MFARTLKQTFDLVQFYFYSVYCNQDYIWVLHRNPEPDLQTSNSGSKNSFLILRNLEQDQVHMGGEPTAKS